MSQESKKEVIRLGGDLRKPSRFLNCMRVEYCALLPFSAERIYLQTSSSLFSSLSTLSFFSSNTITTYNHIIWFPFVISFISILYHIRFIYSTNINQEPSNSLFDFSQNEDHSNSRCFYPDFCSNWTFRAGAGPRARRF